MPRPEGSGRKATTRSGRPRHVRLVVRVDDEEHQELKDASDKPVATFLRETGLAKAKTLRKNKEK